MGWCDVYHIMSEEDVERYELEADESDKKLLSHWFGVKNTFNKRGSDSHLISVSLFWKSLSENEEDIGPITRDRMQNAAATGLISRYDPWRHYVLPLIEGANLIRVSRPDVVFRVYLAADLDFLIPDLLAVGCEVKLMESESIRHNPGAMWRFLALKEDRLVTIIDADRAVDAIYDIQRTEELISADLSLWRAPYMFDFGGDKKTSRCYRPINASQFGARGDHDIERWMKAFIWKSLRNEFSLQIEETTVDKWQIAPEHRWPNYGFDEWFLSSVLYPRVAAGGILTFIKESSSELTPWHMLDIEYTTWANPRSEVIIYTESIIQQNKPWDTWRDKEIVKRRSQSVAYKRERRILGPIHQIYSTSEPETISSLPSVTADLNNALAWISNNVTEKWWIDVSSNLRIANTCAELFLDRRYDRADLVVCGSYFIRVTQNIEDWALAQELDMNHWSCGRNIKIPKVDGPLTMWKLEFLRMIESNYLERGANVPIGVILKGLMEKKQAQIIETTASSMGWKVR